MTRPVTAIAADLVEAWEAWSIDTGGIRADVLITELRDALAQQPTTTRDRLEKTMSAECHNDWCGGSIGEPHLVTADEIVDALAAAPDLSRDAEVARLRKALTWIAGAGVVGVHTSDCRCAPHEATRVLQATTTPAEDAGSHAETPECPRCDDRSAAVAAGILCSQCGGSKEMWCDHIEPEPAR